MNEIFAKVTWRPSIGDPNLLGWTIATCHLVSGLICLKLGIHRETRTQTLRGSPDPADGSPDPAGTTLQDSPDPAAHRKTEAEPKEQSALQWVWLVLGISMVFLGLNKQLDLQKLLSQVGKALVKSAGWHDQRGIIQAAFVVGIALLGLAFVAGKIYVTRHRLHEFGFAMIGVASLVAFAIFRAATFNHLRILADRIPAHADAMNAGWELGGSLLVSLGALLAVRRNNAKFPNDLVPTVG